MQAACGFVTASWGHWGGGTTGSGSFTTSLTTSLSSPAKPPAQVVLTPPKHAKGARSRGYRAVATADRASREATVASSSETPSVTFRSEAESPFVRR